MQIICQLLGIYVIVVFGRILLSWFPTEPGGVMAGIQSFAYMLTEPLLGPLRRVLPPVGFGGMGFDLSPIVVIFGVYFLQGVLCS